MPPRDAFGGAVWRADSPIPEGVAVDDGFDVVLEHSAQAGDLLALLAQLDLPQRLAEAADDPARDVAIRADAEEGLARVGGTSARRSCRSPRRTAPLCSDR